MSGTRVMSGASRLSVVVPVFDEEAVLPEFHKRLRAVLDALPAASEIVYVNDGSGDACTRLLGQIHAADSHVVLVSLSRNFGKEIALTAGLDHAEGDAVIVIDADLQDPPELIAEMVSRWQEGYDVVYAQRTERAGETLLKKVTADLFYRAIHRIGGIRIPRDTGDFRLLSRRVVLALRQLRERHRFMKGLFAWVGFRQVAVPYRRDARYAGQTKWKFWRLWTLAIDALTSFSTAPLKIATYLGLLVAGCAFSYALRIVYLALVYGNPVPGYPSLMTAILFFGGVQLVAIGLVGEYVGRMFDETKGRPLYVLDSHETARSPLGAATGTAPE
jgi:polyisoprenyl-phosphate glycosyltransferase